MTKFLMAVWVLLAIIQIPATGLAGAVALSPVSPSGTVNTTTPTYIWTAESPASSYRLVVLNAKRVTILDQWYTKAEANCSGGTGNCSLTPTTTLSAGNYIWYGIANDGTSKTLTQKNFTVEPATQSSGTPTGTLTVAPSAFNWSAVTGSSVYQLTVTKTGETPVTKWVTSGTAGCVSGSGTCSTSISMNFTDGTYAWTIKPFTSALQAASTWATFTLTTATTPLIVSPTGAITTNTPTYIWNADASATGYFLKITTNNGLVLYSSTLTPTTASCPTGAGTCSITPAVSLPLGINRWSVFVLPSNRSGEASITVPTPTLGTPSPAAPSGTVSNRTPSFSWSAVLSATHYRLKVTDASQSMVIDQTYTTANASCSSGSGTCSVAPGTTLAIGNGSWTIMALNTTNSTQSAESGSVAFAITQPQTAPGTPTLVAPTGTVTTLSPTFSWNATSNANSYIVRVTNANATTVTRIVSDAVAGCPSSSGTCTTVFPNPFTAGTGSWTVQAYSSTTNLTGTASASLSFTLSAPSTASTLLVSPTGTLTTNTPTYVWNAEAGATGYILKVTTNNGLVLHSATLTPAAAGCVAGTGTCTTTPSATLPAGIAKWSIFVTPSLNHGEATVTVPTPALSTPTPIAPTGTVANLTPSFSWSAVQGASNYRLRVTDVNSAMAIDQTYSIASASCSSGLGTCSVSPGTTLAVGNSSWTIMALDTINNTQSAESSRMAFTVAQPATMPGTPTLVSPTGAVTSLAPTFTWGVATNADNYVVKVTDASTTTVTRIVNCTATTGNCTTTFPNLFAAGAGSWTVQAFNSSTNLSGTVSSSLSFTLSADIPSSILVSPAGTIYEKSPSLIWNAVAGATQYMVKVLSTGSIPQTFLNQIYTAAQANCPNGTGNCTITPAIQLSAGSYVWSVGTMPTIKVYSQNFNVLNGLISLSTSTIAENTATPVQIGTLANTDPTAANATYSIIGGSDKTSFEIRNSNQLWITTGVTLNYESKSYLGVQVSGGGSTQSLSVQVTDVNEAPTDITLSASSVAENTDTTANLKIATLTGVDPDQSTPFLGHIFAITGGTDQAKFVINGKNLELVAGTVLNYEAMTPPSFQVQLKVTDGGTLSFTKDVTIAVSNVNEAPTSILLAVASVNENTNTTTNATLGAISALDPDASDTFTYSVTGGTNMNLFVVNGANLQLKAGTALNYEAPTHSLSLEITATDKGNLTLTKSFTLAVNDVNEAPTAISLSPGIVYSNVNNTVAMSTGTLSVTDPDANNTHTCAVTGGTDQASFQITGSVLQLVAGTVLNISTKPTYSVQVTCTDAGNLSLAKTLTVNIENLSNTPTDIQLSNSVLPFIARPTNAVIGILTTTDPGNGSHTYSLLDSLSGRFAITGDQLLLVETTTPIHGTFSLTVRTTNNENLYYEKTFAITVVGFTVETIPTTPTVSTMLSQSRSTYANVYKNLANASVGQQVILSEEELENMVLGKVAQQFTDQGTFSNTITDIINKFDIQISSTLVTVTMKVTLVDVIVARLSSTTKSIANTVLSALAPYANGYVLSVQLRIKPVVSGLNVSLDTASSTVNFVDESDYMPTISMDTGTLITAYNTVVNSMASNDTLAFFLGGGARPPAHFLNEAFSNAVTADQVNRSNIGLNLDSGASRGTSTLADRTQGGLLIPLTQRLDYYFPGLISAVALQSHTIALTRSSLNLASVP